MLVGRGSELEAIGARLTRLTEQRTGGALAVVGPPGIGKTAVLDAAARRSEHCHVLRCSGVQTEQRLPFGALGELLGAQVDLAARLPEPQRVAFEAAMALAPGSDGGSLAVAAAALGIVRLLAEDLPVVLLVDDAQWVDEPTTEVMSFVSRRVDAAAVLVVAAARDDEIPPWLERYERLTLAPLTAEAADELVRRAASDTVARVRSAIVAAAAGVPLALLELTAELDDDERAGRTPTPRVVRPAGRIGDIYLRRVRQLDDASRDALLIAASTAHDTVEVLAVAWRSAGRTIGDLAAAERSGLIRILGDRVQFVHPLVRSAVVHDATAGSRFAAHEALATAVGPAERGWHLATARPGPSDEVAGALEVVGDEATARRAHLRACAAYEEAARRSSHARDRTRRRLLASAAAQRGGDLRRAVSVFDGVEDDLPQLPHAVTIPVLLTLGSGCAQAGQLDRARPLLATVADDVDATTDQAALACALGSYTEFVAGRSAEMFALAARAENLVGEATPRAVMGQVLVAVARSAASLEQAERRERALAELDRMLPDLIEEASRLVPQVAFLLTQFGRAGEMIERVPRLVAAAEQAGEANAVPFLLVAEATAAIELGDWDRAAQRLERSREVALETGLTNTLGSALFLRAQVAALRGDVGLAAGLLDAIDRTTGVLMIDTSARALTALACDDLEGAGAFFRSFWSAAADNRLTNWAPGRVVFGSDAVEVLLTVGDRAGALRVADEIRRRARLGGDQLVRAEAARIEGVLGGTEELDARACFALGLELLGDRPHPFARARHLLHLGEAERRARNPVAARELLADARDTFERLGAAYWLRRAETEFRAAGGRRRRASEAEQGLTERERSVAAAMADGLTNAEIAGRLHMSVKTVESHAGRVFSKLGVRNRTELASAVRRDPGLVGD